LRELDRQIETGMVSRLVVDGGWYAVLRVPRVRSDEALAISLLESEGVLVQPGYFYDFPAEGYVVLSLITPSETFAEGVRRMLGFIHRGESGVN
ncbi:MAG TPA: hypothetical protein VFM10_03125, partial [Terriglobales bacterium]|nr:hypothetical protein [Terriglobales bacterium]